MTIDEAIRHCEEVAWENDRKAMCIEEAYQTTEQQNCEQCAADHRQLAEWLTELKQWRRVYGICPSYEMCIPECKEGYDAQIAEYKRLLKTAVEDLRYLESHTVDEEGRCLISDRGERILCSDCPFNNGGKVNEKCVWNYETEALKLLNDEK